MGNTEIGICILTLGGYPDTCWHPNMSKHLSRHSPDALKIWTLSGHVDTHPDMHLNTLQVARHMQTPLWMYRYW